MADGGPALVPIPRRPRGVFALALAFGLAGCGAGWRAPEPTPTPEPPPRRPAPVPIPPPAPEPVGEPALEEPRESGAPAPIPAAVTAESHYPVPRIWEWTLADGMRVLFRRSSGRPGRVYLLGRAGGGWRGLPGGAPTDISTADGLTLSLRSGETLIEGEAHASDLGAMMRSLAAVLSGRFPREQMVTPETALDAALAGRETGDPSQLSALVARFSRPGAFAVMVSGDTAPDSLIAVAGTALARLRPAAEAYLVRERVETGPPQTARARTIRHPGDGRGSGVLVGFRGVVGGPTRDRRPDEVRAGLDVLGRALVAHLAREGVEAQARVGWDGDAAMITLEARGQDPSELAASVLRAAGVFAVTEPLVGRARGAAVDAHQRAVQTPAGWIDWLTFISSGPVDPRAPHHYPATLRAVPVERVRMLADALLDPARAAVVEIGGE